MCRMIYKSLKNGDNMPTNLAIDDRLIEEAKKIGGHRTKKSAVTDALKEYILRRRQKKILSLFGTLEWKMAYDYKKSRERVRSAL